MELPLKLKLDMNVKNVKESSMLSFTEYWGKFCNFSNKMKNKAKILLYHGWKSLRNIGNDFKSLLEFDISHESVRKVLKNKGGLYWLNEEMGLLGDYGYDAQRVRQARVSSLH